MGSIFVLSDTEEGGHYSLGRRTNVIGRMKALPIHILDEHLSRKHVQIRFDSQKRCYYAFDMKSRHGVSINGTRITEDTALSDGDEIRIGATTILFTTSDFPNYETALSYWKKVTENRPKKPLSS